MDISYVHYALVGLATFVGESFGTIFGGGSFLIQPALLSVGFSPHIAVANDVTAAVFSSGFFVLYSFRARKPDKQIMGWMLPGVTAGALLGGLLMPHIPENIEKWLIIGICCIGFVYTLFHIQQPSQIEGQKRFFPYWRIVAVIVAVFLGMYDGISGAGSGILFITAVSLMFRLDMKTLVVITNLLDATSLATAALTFGYDGLLDTKLLAVMIPACCVAGVVGSKIVHAVSERSLRIAFAGCIALLILHMVL